MPLYFTKISLFRFEFPAASTAPPKSRLRRSLVKAADGFSLLEMLIVVAILGLIAAYAYSTVGGRRASANGGERALDSLARVLEERRNAAIRLNAIESPTSLENYTASPVEINFDDASTTRPLITDGVDSNGDGIDDNTGQAITRLAASSGTTASWNYAYMGQPISLPQGWIIASSAEQLGSIPLIGAGQNGRGQLVSRLGFDNHGRALAPDSGRWQAYPQNSPSESSTINAAPFWSIYVVATPSSSPSSSPTAAVAISVHLTGQLERWRWDGAAWQGFGRRTLN